MDIDETFRKAVNLPIESLLREIEQHIKGARSDKRLRLGYVRASMMLLEVAEMRLTKERGK